MSRIDTRSVLDMIKDENSPGPDTCMLFIPGWMDMTWEELEPILKRSHGVAMEYKKNHKEKS